MCSSWRRVWSASMPRRASSSGRCKPDPRRSPISVAVAYQNLHPAVRLGPRRMRRGGTQNQRPISKPIPSVQHETAERHRHSVEVGGFLYGTSPPGSLQWVQFHHGKAEVAKSRRRDGVDRLRRQTAVCPRRKRRRDRSSRLRGGRLPRTRAVLAPISSVTRGWPGPTPRLPTVAFTSTTSSAPAVLRAS